MFKHDLSNHFQKSKKKSNIFFMFFILALYLNGCKSTQLKTIESLISIIEPTTGREVNRYLQDKEAGFTGPIYAEVFIEYEPLDHYTKRDVYDEIVDTLKKSGWEGEECGECGYDSFSASLQKGEYPIPINTIVRVYSNENLVSVRMVHPKP